MTDILKEVVRKSISPSKGLALLACPTGSGKTHNIAAVVSEEMIEKGSSHRRVFIVSPQLKLIADLLSKIRTNCAKHGCEARVLEIRSQMIHWLDFFSNEKKVEDLKRAILYTVTSPEKRSDIYQLINSLKDKFQFYSLNRSLDKSKLMEEDEYLKEDQKNLNSYLRRYFIKKFYDDRKDMVAREVLDQGRRAISTNENTDDAVSVSSIQSDLEGDGSDNDAISNISDLDDETECEVSPKNVSEKVYERLCQMVEQEYPFLAELYPELTIYRHDVVALTVAKLHQCNTSGYFYGGVMPFWEHVTSDSLVIIDESDMSKAYGLQTILDERLNQYDVKDKMLLANLFIKNIDLLDKSFLGEFDHDLAIWREDLKTQLQKVIASFQKKMRIHSKLDGTRKLDLAQGGAIYHDRDSIFSSSSDAYVEFDDVTDTDYLCTADEESSSCLKLTYVDASLNIFLSEVAKAIKERLKMYMRLNELALEKMSKGKPSANSFSDFTSFRQILRHFQITEERDAWFLLNLRDMYYKSRTADANANDSIDNNRNSIYNKGITITEVNSVLGDPRYCNLSSCKIDAFPENVLVELVKHKGSMILLSSATADSKDPIHNYDLEYIENELDEFYYGLSLINREEKEKLKEFFDEHSAHPEVEFSIVDDDEVSSKEKTEQCLFKLLGNSSSLLEVEGFIRNQKHMAFDIVTMLSNYRDFIADENSHGGLYFTPYSWPRKFLPDNGLGDVFGAERIVKILAQLRKKVFKEENLSMERAEGTSLVFPGLNVAFLSGKSFENDLSKVLEILSENNKNNDNNDNNQGNKRKMLCFIAFGSGSVGVNYQYKVDLSSGGFCTAEKLRKDNKCNMDWIYIQHPSNYIDGDDNSPVSFLRGAVQMSILDEAMQISKEEKTRYVIYMLQRKSQVSNYRDLKNFKNMIPVIRRNIYETPAFREFCVAKIMQSLGRITRTPISRNRITVRIDSKCAGVIGANRVPEAATWLYRYIRGKCPKKSDSQVRDEEKRAQQIRLEGADREIDVEITRIARGARRRLEDYPNDEVKNTILQQRELLERMNQQVLKHPVLDTLDDILEEMRPLYYDTDEFPLVQKLHPADSVHLEILCKEKSIEDYFKEKGYQTRKLPGRYYLHQSVLQQLYSGRIGEYAIKAILKTRNIILEQLPPEIYEEADWYIELDGHKVFIDAKFWSENIRERDTKLDDWARKIKRCDGAYIVVNLPLMKDLDAIRQRTIHSENAPALINGLIDIKTGKIVTKNLNLLVDIIRQALNEE